MVKKVLLAILALGLGLTATAQSNPQTWNQVVTWGGVSYTTANGTSDALRNIGQASHLIEFCAPTLVTSVAGQLEGSFDGVVYFPVSSQIAVGDGECGKLVAGGYWPWMKLAITGFTGTGQVTAFYSASAQLFNGFASVGSGTSITDPCQNPQVAKYTAPVAVSGTGNADIIGPGTGVAVSGAQLYVCALNVTVAGTTPTVEFFAGPTSACSTVTTALSGTMVPTAGSPLAMAAGGASLFVVDRGYFFCTTLGGTSPSMQGVMTFVFQ